MKEKEIVVRNGKGVPLLSIKNNDIDSEEHDSLEQMWYCLLEEEEGPAIEITNMLKSTCGIEVSVFDVCGEAVMMTSSVGKLVVNLEEIK